MYKALLVPSTLPITHSMHYLVSTSHTKSLCMEPIPVHTCTRTRKSFDKESMRKGLNRGGDEARKWGTKGERNQGRVRREKRGKMRGEGRMRRRVCRYLWLVFSASEQIKPILVHFNKNLLRRAVSLVKITTPMHQQQIAHTWPTNYYMQLLYTSTVYKPWCANICSTHHKLCTQAFIEERGPEKDCLPLPIAISRFHSADCCAERASLDDGVPRSRPFLVLYCLECEQESVTWPLKRQPHPRPHTHSGR